MVRFRTRGCICLFKATPRNDRLTALRVACLHIFRQLAQILLEIRQYSCVGFIQADEKSDGAIHTQSLCGVALKGMKEAPTADMYKATNSLNRKRKNNQRKENNLCLHILK